jgi:hypothetical protein
MTAKSTDRAIFSDSNGTSTGTRCNVALTSVIFRSNLGYGGECGSTYRRAY